MRITGDSGGIKTLCNSALGANAMTIGNSELETELEYVVSPLRRVNFPSRLPSTHLPSYEVPLG
jgi:hypothetical protein